MIALLLVAALAAEPPPADDAPRILVQGPLHYPELARELPLPAVRCVLRVSVDAYGAATRVTSAGCPDVFVDEARRDLAAWRFAPATRGGLGVPSILDLPLRWQVDPLRTPPPPDVAQWEWTDRALARLAHQDLVMGVSSAGLAVVGAALFGIATWGTLLSSYRAQYLTAGVGIAMFSVFGIHAGVRLGQVRRRHRQRALWAHFRPPGAS